VQQCGRVQETLKLGKTAASGLRTGDVLHAREELRKRIGVPNSCRSGRRSRKSPSRPKVIESPSCNRGFRLFAVDEQAAALAAILDVEAVRLVTTARQLREMRRSEVVNNSTPSWPADTVPLAVKAVSRSHLPGRRGAAYARITQTPFMIGRGAETGNHFTTLRPPHLRNCAAWVIERTVYVEDPRPAPRPVRQLAEKGRSRELPGWRLDNLRPRDSYEIVSRSGKSTDADSFRSSSTAHGATSPVRSPLAAVLPALSVSWTRPPLLHPSYHSTSCWAHVDLCGLRDRCRPRLAPRSRRWRHA